MSSNRAEAGGISEILTHTLPSTILCDNESVIKNLEKDTPLHPLCFEWDCIEYASCLVHQNKIACHHVRGHYDRKKSEDEMSEEERLHCEAYRL